MKYKKHYETDVAIIGAGPVGLFAVFQAGLLGMKSVLIDSLPELGGQLTALYPEKPIFDIPAFPKILAKDLVARLVEQQQPMLSPSLLECRAETITLQTKKSYPICLMLKQLGNQVMKLPPEDRKIEVYCKAVIIAAGAGAFDHKKPPIANLAEFENTSVFYFVKNPKDFKDKTIVIAGGGDSAVDWAINLTKYTKKIFVVHRRSDFRAAPQSVALMQTLVQQEKITLVIPYQPTGLKGHQGQISEVILQDLDGKERALAADIFLPFYGFASALGPLGQWGMETTPRGQIMVDVNSMLTCLPGVYAVGDVAQYPSKYKLIMQGFADVAVACHHMFPKVTGQDLHFEHSTTRGLPNL